MTSSSDPIRDLASPLPPRATTPKPDKSHLHSVRRAETCRHSGLFNPTTTRSTNRAAVR
jgi:hypothetical protein